MVHIEETHETVQKLRTLVPEAIVAGGSFAGCLPHPRTLPAPRRESMITSTREAAVSQCLRDLLRRAGLDEHTAVTTGKDGGRNWPAGYVGSLTHKGTVVLGVIAETSSVHMLGIDLERIDGDDLTAIEASIAPEGLPPGLDRRLARLVSFAAKEAVFKAQYPAAGRNLNFADVQLSWRQVGDHLRAAVSCPVAGIGVRASVVGGWIVAAAISPCNTDT